MYQKIFIFILFFLLSFAFYGVFARTMVTEFQSVVSDSAPGALVHHSVSFRVNTEIPEGGDIVISFEEGKFLVPDEFSYSDMDLLVKDPDSDHFVARFLDSEINTSENVSGVSIETGTSSNFVINLSEGISSGSVVNIELGFNSSVYHESEYGIFNPESEGSYMIDLETRDQNQDILDLGTTMIAVIRPVDTRVWPRPDEDEEEDWEEGEDEGDDDDGEEEGEGPEEDGPGDSSPGGGGGGGGGGTGGASGPGSGDIHPPDTGSVIFEGLAYPNSRIVILKDGEVVEDSNISGADFIFRLDGLNHGVYNFAVYAVDPQGDRSFTENVTLTVRSNTVNRVSELLMSPTIGQDGDWVDSGEDVELSGYAWPEGDIEVDILREGSSVEDDRFDPDSSGGWSFPFETSELSDGVYTIRTRSWFEDESQKSSWNEAVFGVGVEPDVDTGLTADLNQDGRVNLADFSILLFHWGTSNPIADINNDGNVGLADFSIMLFQWTG